MTLSGLVSEEDTPLIQKEAAGADAPAVAVDTVAAATVKPDRNVT